MLGARFKIGQLVTFSPGRASLSPSSREYKIYGSCRETEANRNIGLNPERNFLSVSRGKANCRDGRKQPRSVLSFSFAV